MWEKIKNEWNKHNRIEKILLIISIILFFYTIYFIGISVDKSIFYPEYFWAWFKEKYLFMK